MMGVDIAVEAWADLTSSVEKLHKKMDTHIGETVSLRRRLTGAVNNLSATGQALVDLGSPAAGLMWIIRGFVAIEHIPGNQNPGTASATGAAGASVSASVPFFSPFLTGFDLSIPPAAAAGNGTVTVTGAGLPTLTYNFSETTTAPVNLSIRYPAPGIPQGTVTVSAVASGGAATINLMSAQSGSPALVSWYIGQPPLQANIQPSLASVVWQPVFNNLAQTFPEFDTFTDDILFVYPTEHIMAWFTAGIPGENFIVQAVVEEYYLSEYTKLRLKAGM